MPRRRRVSDPVPERYLRDGLLSIGRYQVALLHGLLDRPGGSVSGARELIRAAWPYGARIRAPDQALYSTLRVMIPRLPTAWVARRKAGRFTLYQLLPRGKAVLEGQVPARLSGRERYRPGSWRAGR